MMPGRDATKRNAQDAIDASGFRALNLIVQLEADGLSRTAVGGNVESQAGGLFHGIAKKLGMANHGFIASRNNNGRRATEHEGFALGGHYLLGKRDDAVVSLGHVVLCRKGRED